MSGQCFLNSPVETACDDLSLPSLSPFLGNPCDGDSMHVCATDELNEFLSSCPLTTILPHKVRKTEAKIRIPPL